MLHFSEHLGNTFITFLSINDFKKFQRYNSNQFKFQANLFVRNSVISHDSNLANWFLNSSDDVHGQFEGGEK